MRFLIPMIVLAVMAILLSYLFNRIRSQENREDDKEGNEITILDILKTPSPDFAMDIQKEDNINDLKKYFNVLTKREKEILINRYGLDNNDEITLDYPSELDQYSFNIDYIYRLSLINNFCGNPCGSPLGIRSGFHNRSAPSASSSYQCHHSGMRVPVCDGGSITTP